MPLGMQANYAGRGDLVQARRNGWDLAGYQGNRRGPINRETYRVLDTNSDGSLVVAPIVGRSAEGEQHGDRMTLPASYVAEHVALGYASTVHAAQGVTVETTHAVVTARTGPEALYVGMSRGRHANTAHVVTQPVADDAEPGEVNQAVHRSPQAVLAGIFDTRDPQLSALAEAADSQADAESARTPGELFADAAEIATANRTAAWLDQLVAEGDLTDVQRTELAAEDRATTLNTLLRRVELAGHDPNRRLIDAIRSRPLDDARQISNVLQARIKSGTDLDPVGDSYAKRMPVVEDPQWRSYIATLAAAADDRRDELGEQTAVQPPAWAVEALGPVPGDDDARQTWQQRAGVAAAHRELVGVEDPGDMLGPAPKAGQVEAYASWRAAWRALGRPEADRAEAEMSTGQLRIRVRAYERERTWAPAYVANELAATHQAADKHRHDAAVRRAEAAATADEIRRDELGQQAEQAQALTEALVARADVLAAADEARAQWYAHTAETRAAAERAQAELSTRDVDHDEPDDPVTADQWLQAHAAAVEAEDPYREITDDHQLVDTERQRDTDRQAAGIVDPGVDAAELASLDVRQETDHITPDDHQRDAVRVPTADETTDAVDRARRALLELHQRTAIEQQRRRDEESDRDLATQTPDDNAGGEAHAGQDTQRSSADVDNAPVIYLTPLDD